MRFLYRVPKGNGYIEVRSLILWNYFETNNKRRRHSSAANHACHQIMLVQCTNAFITQVLELNTFSIIKSSNKRYYDVVIKLFFSSDVIGQVPDCIQ